jgi:hypothetical protein
MGDRTTVYIEVLASERDAVVRVFGDPDNEHQPETSNTVLLTFAEVNYGRPDLLAALARSRLSFRGSLRDGIDYHGMTFAAHDGELEESAGNARTLTHPTLKA